jgi:N-acyl-D-aspartate/D-glutamate deacylase
MWIQPVVRARRPPQPRQFASEAHSLGIVPKNPLTGGADRKKLGAVKGTEETMSLSGVARAGKLTLGIAAILLLSFWVGPKTLVSAQDHLYDVVIANGRVMDPESGLDGVRNVGISEGKIREISGSALKGRQTIDAKWLVVAPGFIDLHEHGQDPRNYQFQAHDGVTTSLELEAGTNDVAKWYAQREGKSLINFGVSIGHIPVRAQVVGHAKGDLGSSFTRTPEAEEALHREATPGEINEMKDLIAAGMKQGALAEGMGINYTPGASRWEIVEMFRIAAKFNAPVHVHLRYAGLIEPETGLNAIEEVIAAAAATGAPLHVVHITSMGLKNTPELIAMVDGARKRGLDVTTECYPYTAASTGLHTAIFDPGWQARMGIDYKDLQWAETGERLTAETFEKYRKQGGIVVIHVIPEEAAGIAVAIPMVMIASDGMPITGARVHPRGQGTFSRVLGHYVREEKVLDLMTALRKMTLMPAQRLEKRAPTFKNKGRIRVGADADITVFDPNRVIDKATYEQPLQFSEGIPFVLVNGVPGVKDGQLVDGVFPGRAARAPISQ